MRQFSANTQRAPPEIWLPTTTPPWPSFMRQLRIRMFCDGVARRRPSALRPEFTAMQSSPVSKEQSSISM